MHRYPGEPANPRLTMHRPHRARVTPEYDVASEPDLAERARSGTQSLYARFGKRALDLLMVSVALVPALAIGLPVALWNLVVFRDPSKVFFSQHRVGRGGRRFRMFKFRTMRDANHALDQTWFTGRDAARVTRFGRFLRNTHLDELPQLFNVFLGDMHLVGPRPEMPDVHRWASKLVPEFPARLTGRPGLTGRAQVTQGYTGASAEAYRQKLAIDVEYLESISLAGDLGIIARTIPWVLQGRGWRWNKSTPAEQPAVAAALEPETEAAPEGTRDAVLPANPPRPAVMASAATRNRSSKTSRAA